MEITCENCQARFRIPDDKIPPGKTAALPCPKCKHRITVTSPENPAPAPEPVPVPEPEADFSGPMEDEYDAMDKPFDFVEEEGKTALLCEPDPIVRGKLATVLSSLQYHVTESETTREALKSMRFHMYDLIVVNERFDSPDPDKNGVLVYLERLTMDIRRRMFIALISDRFRTMDNMMAFNKSVNIVISLKNIDDTEKILSRAITENEMFYRVFMETLKSLGRI